MSFTDGQIQKVIEEQATLAIKAIDSYLGSVPNGEFPAHMVSMFQRLEHDLDKDVFVMALAIKIEVLHTRFQAEVTNTKGLVN